VGRRGRIASPFAFGDQGPGALGSGLERGAAQTCQHRDTGLDHVALAHFERLDAAADQRPDRGRERIGFDPAGGLGEHRRRQGTGGCVSCPHGRHRHAAQRPAQRPDERQPHGQCQQQHGGRQQARRQRRPRQGGWRRLG
jgi:hypothetical protein